MLLFKVLLVHEHLIDISFQVINIFLHDGVLIPHMDQESLHTGVGPWSHGYGARMPVEVRVTAGRRELPYAGSRACKAELPCVAPDVEHLGYALLSGMCKGRCRHEVKGVPGPGRVDQAIFLAFPHARAAVAETGSLIISTGLGRPLTASLLPDVHLAILKEEDILPDLTHALSLEEIREASSTVIISGPSRTADIEMTLTIGVHGPGQLYVFCLVQ